MVQKTSYGVWMSLFLIHFSLTGFSQNSDTSKAAKYFNRALMMSVFSRERDRLMDSAIKYDHQEAYYWQQKAMPLLKMKKYELAMMYIDSAVKYDRTHHWAEYRASMRCIFQKSYTKAIQEFQELKKVYPKGVVMDHSYDFHIGLSYLQLNQFDSAFQYIKSSVDEMELKFKQGHYTEYFYLGIIEYERENFIPAMTYFDLALKYYSRYSDAKYYKARCLQRLNRHDEASKLFEEAKRDFEVGKSFQEDQIYYEEYPYQVKKYWFH